jgi:hypothetical protein
MVLLFALKNEWFMNCSINNNVEGVDTMHSDFFMLSATFSNISAISWRPVLVVEEAGVPGKNHRPWASNW